MPNGINNRFGDGLVFETDEVKVVKVPAVFKNATNYLFLLNFLGLSIDK